MFVIRENREDLLKIFPPHSIGAEIGVWKGDYSAEILNRTACKELHLIDCWQHQDVSIYGKDPRNVAQKEHEAVYNSVCNRFSKDIDVGRVVIHRSFSHEAARKFEVGYFDWVYVDGNHSFDTVTQDLGSFLPKVKPDGLICGHDYTNSVWARQRGFEVVAAVNQFVLRNGLEMVFLTREFWPSYGLARTGRSAEQWKEEIECSCYIEKEFSVTVPTHFEHVIKFPSRRTLIRRVLDRFGITRSAPPSFSFSIDGHCF